MKTKTIWVIILMFFTSSIFQAQSKKNSSKKKPKLEAFSFGAGNCDNLGYFDPSKYSRKQLEGAYALYLRNFDIHARYGFNISFISEIKKDFPQYSKELEDNYKEVKSRFQKIQDVPNTNYWNDLKTNIAKNIEWNYQFEKSMLNAYKDVNSLKDVAYNPACSKYVDALTSKDKKKKIAVWKELAISGSKNNADPKGVIDTFETNSKSTDWEEYGFIELIMFGYANCSYNHKPDKNVIGNTDENDDKELYKLFEKVKKLGCDEP